MAQKFGGAIGGFILLQVLAFAAYNKDVVVQAPETLAAIKAFDELDSCDRSPF